MAKPVEVTSTFHLFGGDLGIGLRGGVGNDSTVAPNFLNGLWNSHSTPPETNVRNPVQQSAGPMPHTENATAIAARSGLDPEKFHSRGPSLDPVIAPGPRGGGAVTNPTNESSFVSRQAPKNANLPFQQNDLIDELPPNDGEDDPEGCGFKLETLLDRMLAFDEIDLAGGAANNTDDDEREGVGALMHGVTDVPPASSLVGEQRSSSSASWMAGLVGMNTLGDDQANDDEQEKDETGETEYQKFANEIIKDQLAKKVAFVTLGQGLLGPEPEPEPSKDSPFISLASSVPAHGATPASQSKPLGHTEDPNLGLAIGTPNGMMVVGGKLHPLPTPGTGASAASATAGAPAPAAPAAAAPHTSFACEMCEVDCPDRLCLEQHEQGKSHQRKFRYFLKRSVAITGTTFDFPTNALQMFFTNLNLYLDQAKKIPSWTFKLKDPSKGPHQVITFVTPEEVPLAEQLSGQRLWGFVLHIERLHTPSHCEICDMDLNSETQYHQHLSSKVHYSSLVRLMKAQQQQLQQQQQQQLQQQQLPGHTVKSNTIGANARQRMKNKEQQTRAMGLPLGTNFAEQPPLGFLPNPNFAMLPPPPIPPPFPLPPFPPSMMVSFPDS